MNNIFCIFKNESDAYTYSSEWLVGVFLDHDSAEIALLEHIDLMSKIKKAKNQYDERCRWLLKAFHDEMAKKEKVIPEADKKAKKAKQRKKEVEGLKWNAARQEYFRRQAELEMDLLKETKGIEFMDDNINNYEIRTGSVGSIELDYDLDALNKLNKLNA